MLYIVFEAPMLLSNRLARFEDRVPTASVRTAKRSIQAILDAIGRGPWWNRACGL